MMKSHPRCREIIVITEGIPSSSSSSIANRNDSQNEPDNVTVVEVIDLCDYSDDDFIDDGDKDHNNENTNNNNNDSDKNRTNDATLTKKDEEKEQQQQKVCENQVNQQCLGPAGAAVVATLKVAPASLSLSSSSVICLPSKRNHQPEQVERKRVRVRVRPCPEVADQSVVDKPARIKQDSTSSSSNKVSCNKQQPLSPSRALVVVPDTSTAAVAAAATVSNSPRLFLACSQNQEQPQCRKEEQQPGSASELLLILQTEPNEPVGAVTHNLLFLLRQTVLRLQQQQLQPCSAKTNTTSTTSSTFFYLAHSPDNHFYHIQQTDQWSCGYRNLQMLLSAWLPLLPASHPYWRHRTCDPGTLDLPSIVQLQSTLEQGWAAGKDPAGAHHYQHAIVHKSAWIGAVEGQTILTQAGLDATVIQFVTCTESRSWLGRVCYAHFARRVACPHCGRGGSNGTPMKQQQTTLEYACALLEWVQDDLQGRRQRRAERGGGRVNHHRQTKQPPSKCQCPILPLYLQYQGHSLTVIGVEGGTGRMMADHDDAQQTEHDRVTHLLVADPMHDGSQYVAALQANQVHPLRRPCHALQQKDSQIIIAGCLPVTAVTPSSKSSKETTRAMDDDHISVEPTVLTAAHESVRKARLKQEAKSRRNL